MESYKYSQHMVDVNHIHHGKYFQNILFLLFRMVYFNKKWKSKFHIGDCRCPNRPIFETKCAQVCVVRVLAPFFFLI